MATDDALTETFIRAFLAGGGDASAAMMEKAIGQLASISDDLTRELFGFFNGFLSASAWHGFGGAAHALQRLHAEKAEADPEKMRAAIRAALGSICEGNN